MRKPTDDEIMALWRTVRPSEAQTAVMTWIDCAERGEETTRPMWELRELVELAMQEGGEGPGGQRRWRSELEDTWTTWMRWC